MKRAILYTVMFIVIQLVVSFTVQGVWMLASGRSAADMDAMTYIIIMGASNVAAILVFLYFHWAEVSRSYVRSRPWAALCWCCVAALGAVVPSIAFQEQMPELPNLVEKEFDMILQNRWGYFAVGLLAPLGEELVFRGAVLRTLLHQQQLFGIQSRRAAAWTAIAVSALLFALVHGNPAQMPHAFLIGLLLGWFYYRTDSVVPGVAYHWVNNSVAYVMYNLYPDPDMRLIDLFGSQRTVMAAVCFSLFILVPAIYQLNLRLRKASEE